VERDLGGLGERADQQQDAARDELGWLIVNTPPSTSAKVFRKSSVCVPLKMKYVPSTSPTSPSTLMTNALMPGLRRRRAAIPERDQEVRGGADERPADDQQEEVGRQDEQQHAEDEEVQ
jgi:hypothetical protein